MGSGASAPTPASVGQELASSVGALTGGTGGAVGNSQLLYGAPLSQINTGLNLQNVQTLSNAFFGNQFGKNAGTQGISQAAQNQAVSLGNSFLSNQVGQLGSNLGTITGDINSTNPYASTLQSTATGSNFLGAGLNSTLSGLEKVQANLGSSINPTLSDISQTARMGAGSAFSAANPAFAGANALMGNAQQQLALGSSISPTESAQIAQASSEADSSRGIFDSNTSAFNQSLAEGQYGQSLLAQREGYATAAGNTSAGLMGAGASLLGTGGSLLGVGSSAESAGLGAQQGFLQGAAQTQGQNLSQMFQRQNMGLSQLGSLTSMGNQNALAGTSFVTGQSGMYGAGLGASLFGQGLNTLMSSQANPTPSFFNSLGLFNAAHDNANTAYNAQFAANEQNAQAQNSLTGAGIGAGIGAAGSVAAATSSAWGPALAGGLTALGGVLAAF